jgi:hypothetical protein
MIECSTCGNCLGHLYRDYVRLAIQLSRDLASDVIPEPKDKRYTYGDGDSIAPFLHTYYTWVEQNPKYKDIYEPQNVVARAMLRLRELKPEHLPFGKPAADGQRNQYEAALCCLRMLQLDPSSQISH